MLVNPEVNLAPDPPFRAARWPTVETQFRWKGCLRTCHSPFPSTLMPVLSTARQDIAEQWPRGDQQVQRPLGTAIRDVHGKRFLAAGQRAEVGQRPAKADQAQQAFDDPGRLPQRHAEQHLHRQIGLDRGIAVDLMPATPARRHGIPAHLGVKPALRRLLAIAYRPVDRQRAPAFQHFVIGRPVLDLAGRGCQSAHARQLPRWIHEMSPSCDLCNEPRAGASIFTSRMAELKKFSTVRHRCSPGFVSLKAAVNIC